MISPIYIGQLKANKFQIDRSIWQVQEVEQTLNILPFCVVFLVSLQTRHYEQYATNFLLLENDKDLDFYGSKCHKMLPLDQQYDTRTI